MLSVNGVSQSFGGKVLFDNVNQAFTPGRRYGLTGPNGAGKSTFMKFLAGIEEPMRGSVSRPKKTSFLRQDHYRYDEHTALDTVLMGNAPLWSAMKEKNEILAKLEAGEEMTDDIGMRLGDLEGVVAEEDGYTAEADAAVLLDGLGIGTKLHGEVMKNLSGGLKLRVLLAQALFGKPDCLLLDEPTNHLDLDSIQWLEDFLKQFEGVLVVISHDKHFLNSVTTHIADIDYEMIFVYTGNYDEMVLQKVQVRGRLEQENSDKQKKVEQLRDFISRFGAGTRSSQATSRRKEMEKLQLNDLKRSNIARPFIRFEVGEKPSGRNVLRVEGLSKMFVEKGKPDVRICKDLDLNIMRGDKVAIIGPSGIGKTTLLRLILKEMKADEGEIVWGHEVRIGYFAQDHREGIPQGVRIWQWLNSFDEKATREDIRGLLGRMLFQGEEGEKLTTVLSGGETARILFSKLMLVKDNVLIFDEPTNHLDLESIVALREAIVRFEGTVIFVTHDRDLVSEAATRIISMSKNGIDDFNGGYEDFTAKVGGVKFDR